MIIASYRNTEKNIRVVVPVTSVTDEQLLQAVAVKRQQYVLSIADGMGQVWTVPAHKCYRPRFDRIAQRICRVFGVTLMDLKSPRRHQASVFARQAIYYWARRLTALSMSQIGRMIGNRDHTTVLYGVARYQEKRLVMGRSLRVLHSSGNTVINAGVSR